MSNNTNFSTFPKNKIEALTMLYLENQDLSNLKPEEVLSMYNDVYDKICSKDHKIKTKENEESLKNLDIFSF